MDTINAAGMDETYGTYGADECFDIHDYDDDTGHDTDDADDADDDTDDDTNDDTDDDTDDGGRGNRRPLPDLVVEASQAKKKHTKIPRTLLEVFGT